MSKELTEREVGVAFDAIRNVQSAAELAQERADSLSAYIDWLKEQLAERDARIEELQDELDSIEA